MRLLFLMSSYWKIYRNGKDVGLGIMPYLPNFVMMLGELHPLKVRVLEGKIIFKKSNRLSSKRPKSVSEWSLQKYLPYKE